MVFEDQLSTHNLSNMRCMAMHEKDGDRLFATSFNRINHENYATIFVLNYNNFVTAKY